MKVTTINTIFLRPMFIIYIMIVIPGSLCKECSSLMGDDNRNYLGPVIKLQESCCFVNECTVRTKSSNVLLNIVNNTKDWLLATNATSLFTTFINDNIHSCSDDNSYQPINSKLYVIRMVGFSAGIIAAVVNISNHLLFKELRTVFGILIIILCVSMGIGLAIYVILTSTVFYYQIITQVEICAVFIYFLVVDQITYEATKTAILAHFAYTMYRSYKCLGVQEKQRSLLCRYITFIVVASTITSSIIIIVDLIVNERAFAMKEESCSTFWGQNAILSLTNIFLVVNILIWLLTHIILVIIGAVLYILTTRQCCTGSTFSRNFRVSIILTVTIDFCILVFMVLLAVHVPPVVAFSVLPAAPAIEQAALIALFISSSKVKCRL